VRRIGRATVPRVRSNESLAMLKSNQINGKIIVFTFVVM